MAFHTLAGGWARSRVRTSVHFSPSLGTSAVMSLLSFHGRLVHLVEMFFQGIDLLRPILPEGAEPGVEHHQRFWLESIQASLGFNARFHESRLSQDSEVL